MSVARCLSLAAVLGASVCSVSIAAEPEGRAEATLTLDLRKLDFENNRKLGLMYMPASVKVTGEKPVQVTKGPQFRGEPRYAVVTLGSGDKNQFAIALDEPEGQDAKFYPDLNGNGDLTDDGDGAWQEKKTPEGQSPSYQGTYAFNIGWKNADGSKTDGQYALNFYRSPDRDSLNYYRATARVGEVTIGGKKYEVMLTENDSDARFDKLYDPTKPTPVEKLPRPVYLKLDGDQFDIRGTFGFGDYNYIARVSDDGAKLTLEPTSKLVRVPRPTERPTMLASGAALPDFEAIMWDPEAKPGATPAMFKMSDFKGKKVVVLDLWATWCGPCMKGIPHISKVAEQIKGQDVEVIALNVWDDPAAYERFAKEKGPKYAFKLARDPAGRERDASVASRIFKLSGIPATYVIDKAGKIVASISGYREGDRELEYALVRQGIKIDGIKPEDAAEPAKTEPVKMVPMKGLK